MLCPWPLDAGECREPSACRADRGHRIRTPQFWEVANFRPAHLYRLFCVLRSVFGPSPTNGFRSKQSFRQAPAGGSLQPEAAMPEVCSAAGADPNSPILNGIY